MSIMEKIKALGEKLGYDTLVISDLDSYKAAKITSTKMPMAEFVLVKDIARGTWKAITNFGGTDVECGSATDDDDCISMLICFATGCSKAEAVMEARRAEAELYADEYDDESDDEYDDCDEECDCENCCPDSVILDAIFEKVGRDPKTFNDFIRSLRLGDNEKKFLIKEEAKPADKTAQVEELLKKLIEVLR